MIKKLAAIIVLSLAFIGPVSGDTFDDALTDYNAGNYKAAVAGFVLLAYEGDAAAQYNLAFMVAH